MTRKQHQFTLLPRHRNTKIVATLGPASGEEDQIEALLRAGADVFRLNFSHGAVAEHRARVAAIRRIEALYDHPICIIADLQGPKLRIGTFAAGLFKFRLVMAFASIPIHRRETRRGSSCPIRSCSGRFPPAPKSCSMTARCVSPSRDKHRTISMR
jgi:hypothetical protein